MKGTEQFIAEWLISQSKDQEVFSPYVYKESDGTFTLDGVFNIKNLALALDKRRQKDVFNRAVP